MASGGGENFDVWLSDKLQALKMDETVFSSYIRGILEGNDTDDEKSEALEEILSEITQDAGIKSHCLEILSHWKVQEEQTSSTTNQQMGVSIDIDKQLAEIMEKQAQCVTVTKSYTDEQKKIREAILSNYSEVCDGEEGVAGGEAEGGEGEDSESSSDDEVRLVARNTNAENVARAEREKREKAKVDSTKKKEKDKEDREKQKQQEHDRKDKEKKRTQKGEKRR